MSLHIHVSANSVLIEKYGLEFPFLPPPAEIAKPALDVYQLLRGSASMQGELKRKERREVVGRLQRYGFVLFRSVVPQSFREKACQEGGIFVFGMDAEAAAIPWELLFDGTAFLTLTQGVVRINRSGFPDFVGNGKKEQSRIHLSLNSYSPLPTGNDSGRAEESGIGSRFILPVENLTRGTFSKLSYIVSDVCGNASRKVIFEELEKAPDLFLFSGYDLSQGWLLSDRKQINARLGWFDRNFQSKLLESIRNGLRILCIATSELLENPGRSAYDPLCRYFDIGIPYVLALHGRVDFRRFRRYFQNFVLSLTRRESILRAHRLALNGMRTEMPLSWDWSWIRLHVNKALLTKRDALPLAPFSIVPQREEKKSVPPTGRHFLTVRRRFSGRRDTLLRLVRSVSSSKEGQFIGLISSEGSSAEQYFYEAARRLCGERAVTLYCLYYMHWGFHGCESNGVPKHIVERFPPVFREEAIHRYFDECLMEAGKPESRERPARKLLIVLYPPDRADAIFDRWLRTKLEAGWTIVTVADHANFTRLPFLSLPTNEETLREIDDRFEDSLPEQWIDRLRKNAPRRMMNCSLLAMVKHFGDPQLIEAVGDEQNADLHWKEIFERILPSLASQKVRILFYLYLLRVKTSKRYLMSLLSVRKIENDLEHLIRLNLIDCNFDETHFWVPFHIRSQLARQEMFSSPRLIEFVDEVLGKQIAALNRERSSDSRLPVVEKMMGFQYCLTELAALGATESALQRSIQISRKFAGPHAGRNGLFLQIVRIGLELAHLSRKEILVQKTILTAIETVGYLLSENETIGLYLWRLNVEEKKRNWPLVAKIQVKLARLYTETDQKQKAIGLVASAIQLNNDIKNFSSRTQNLTTIALLLLDMEDFEQLGSLLDNARFDFNLLGAESIAKLWLIDGHLLFRSKEYDEAASALAKVPELRNLNLSDSLMAKTYGIMAKTYDILAEKKERQGKTEEKIECVRNAAKYYGKIGDDEASIKYHKQLWRHFADIGDVKSTISHLEHLYRFLKKRNEKKDLREIAHQLGVMYFKKGEKGKSAEYYKIAQGI